MKPSRRQPTIGQEDAQLGGCAQQQALGVGDQGAEVGHGAHAHEDEAGIDAQLDAQIQHVDQTDADSDITEDTPQLRRTARGPR